MKKFICIAIALLLLAASFVACDSKDEETEPHVAPKLEEIDLSEETDISKFTISETETDYVIIEVEKFGSIVVRLYPDVAPETVANFKKLVSEGFYDGLTFHRVISGFMIQGGDPKGDGTGGSEDKIKGEFSSNGFENNLLHTRGVVSMARANDPDSASSQFFIVHEDSDPLDGSYAAFGYVIFGMDVVDDIADVRVNSSDKPVSKVVISSIKFVNYNK